MRIIYKRKIILLMVAFFLLFSFPYSISAKENLSPITNSGKKWRIGYFEGEGYYEFTEQLKYLFEALISIRLIDKVEVPEMDTSEKDSARKFWSWMSRNTKSDYVEFVDDAFWSNTNEEDSCKVNKEDIYERAVKEKYIDLMVAMGTVAGKCLSQQKEYNVNTMVMCASNPVYSEIVKNPECSGVEHIHATIEKDEFFNEINLFYQLVGFKKLGIVYQDTPEGRVYAAIEDARRFKEEHHNDKVELVALRIPGGYSEEQRKEVLPEIYQDLAGQVDAIYITEHLEENKDNIDLLKKLL
ncbi:MAG: hypothetical protein D3908_02905, partial [Candidatus Electrothrix sp. AUS4]|nr:hypothetical protein [Candidatus Electrothrix sp. AUS4]